MLFRSRCEVELAGKIFRFIIDSGAVANIVSLQVYEKIKNHVILKPPARNYILLAKRRHLGSKVKFKVTSQQITGKPQLSFLFTKEIVMSVI